MKKVTVNGHDHELSPDSPRSRSHVELLQDIVTSVNALETGSSPDGLELTSADATKNVITAASSDATTTSSVAALTFKNTVAHTANDLEFQFLRSDDTSLLKVDKEGDTTVAGALAASNLSGTNTGNITLAAVGSTPAAAGASLSGQALTLQPASASFPGVVTTAAQTIAGAKTFSSGVIVGAAGITFNDTTTLTTASAAGGWTTAMDLDLTAEGSQTLATNGAYTIGGKTWTKVNSVGDSTAAAITAGQGLVLTPTGTTDLNGTTKTLPGITIPLTGISASLDWNTPMRLLFYVSSSNSAANYDAAVVGLWNSTLDSYHAVKMLGYYGGAKTFLHHRSWAGTGSSFFGLTAFANSDVCCMELPLGLQQLHVNHLAGTYAVGFPANTAMSPTYNHWPGSDYVQANTIVGSFANWTLLLGAQRSGSGTAYVAKFARVMVQYKP